MSVGDRMYKMIAHFAIFVSVSLFLQAGLGFAFHIEIKPNTVNGLVHNDVSIACRLSDDDVKEVVHIHVFKQGQAIAVFRQDSRLSIPKGLQNHFKATGKIQKPTRDSYLNVLMSNPTMEDSGEYTCILYYLDETSVLKEKKKSANFTVTNQEVKSTLRYLVDELSEMKSELAREKNKSRDRESELQQQIDSQGIQLTQRLRSNEQTENRTVTFTAIHTSGAVIAKGDAIVFNSVIANEGQGYNGNTGVFTAPFAGYYVFHLTVNLVQDKRIFFDLESSNGQKLIRINVGDKQWQAHSSGSCLAKLEAGERIKPVARYVHNNPKLYHYERGDRMNQFSGYLLKAL